jgi:hypothetical protein
MFDWQSILIRPWLWPMMVYAVMCAVIEADD